ncbi:NAD(P)-dependent alcohol dehydrogenase [Actinospongicola halichondriae]|uniref:NAD(P)-dependent alcohol dehydrogenase n=1 Tax=Actinospongicola halichondriae TaxID=3236844 RepID=UPI003D434FA6
MRTTTPAPTTTMRAVRQERFGTVAAEVLSVEEIERPTVGPDEVLVRVHAAGVDRGVWHLMAGLPYAVRAAGFGIRAPKQPVPGLDLSGTVVEVGADVDAFAIGDEVYGVGIGAFAEYAVAKAAKLAPRPANLDPEHAAAVAISGLTALQAVRDHAKVEPGQRVLVVGASGGVGSYAVQIAKAYGAEVTGVASTGKVDLVRSLGADHVIDYSTTDFTEGSLRYDVIIDTGGNRKLTHLRRVLDDDGTLVIVGGEGGGRWLGGTDRQLRAMALSPFVSQKLGTFISSENGEDLLEINALIEAGKVTPAVDRVLPLEQAAEALDLLTTGRVSGKLVLRVTSAEGED